MLALAASWLVPPLPPDSAATPGGPPLVQATGGESMLVDTAVVSTVVAPVLRHLDDRWVYPFLLKNVHMSILLAVINTLKAICAYN